MGYVNQNTEDKQLANNNKGLYLWTDESRSIHDTLGQWWKHIWRNQVLSEYHGEVIKEGQHENLEEVHDHKKLEVPFCEDLPHQSS